MANNEKGVLSQKCVNKAISIYNDLINANSSNTRSCNKIISYCEKANKYFPHPDAYLILSKAIHLKSTNLPKKKRFDLIDLAVTYSEKAIDIFPDINHPLCAELYFWNAFLNREWAGFCPTIRLALRFLDTAEKGFREALRVDPNHNKSINCLNELIEKKDRLITS